MQLENLFDSILMHLLFSDPILLFYFKIQPKIFVIMFLIALILHVLATFLFLRNMNSCGEKCFNKN